jgi:hypothetical protein
LVKIMIWAHFIFIHSTMLQLFYSTSVFVKLVYQLVLFVGLPIYLCAHVNE